MNIFNEDYRGCKPIKTIDLWVPIANKRIKVLSPAGFLYLNESAARMWQMINGETSVEKIADQLSREFPEVSWDKHYDDAISTLKLLEKYELIVINWEPF